MLLACCRVEGLIKQGVNYFAPSSVDQYDLAEVFAEFLYNNMQSVATHLTLA